MNTEMPSKRPAIVFRMERASGTLKPPPPALLSISGGGVRRLPFRPGRALAIWRSYQVNEYPMLRLQVLAKSASPSQPRRPATVSGRYSYAMFLAP